MRAPRIASLSAGLHWGVLIALLVLTYARLFAIPYKGFDVDTAGQVLEIYVQGSPADPLQPGDYLRQAADMTWSQFRADYSAVMFNHLKAGDTVPLIIERNGAQRVIEWTYPGLNGPEFTRYALTAVWLAYFFWFFGFMTARYLRPIGEPRAIAVAFYYFLAFGLALGGDTAFSHIWYTGHLFRLTFWMGVPLVLHFHWVWPRPLGTLHPVVRWISYGAAFLTFLGKTLGLLPGDEFVIVPAVAILGILILLALHAILQPAFRRSLGALLIIAGAAMLPVAAYPLLEHHTSLGLNELLTSLGLPLIPLAYSFAAYRRRLSPIEMRLNALAVSYAFLFVAGIAILPLLMLISLQSIDRAATFSLAVVTGILSAAAGMVGFPLFKSYFERHVLGFPVPADELVADYVSRITAAPSIPRLVALLKESALPSLLVRQFLFVRLDRPGPEILLAIGLSESEIPSKAELLKLAERGDDYSAAPAAVLPGHPWVRLVLTLRVEDERLGLWLLGRRDPDDQYLDHEAAIIRSLADQTAILFSHCLQTERLRELYQADVKRTEEERLQLALMLHDSVLNQLAALMMKLDDPSVTPELLALFEQFSTRLRGLVSELRPPMLVYGLCPALKGLADTLQERTMASARISAEDLSGEARYPQAVELHLYRIVQEGCENAILHSRASEVTISGRLEPDRASIQVEDNGVGFEALDGPAVGRLIARKHFGLAGMIERANLIGAEIQITTAPGEGARVQVTWSVGADGAAAGSH